MVADLLHPQGGNPAGLFQIEVARMDSWIAELFPGFTQLLLKEGLQPTGAAVIFCW
ncbi:hypothetical protein D3C80_1964310 [compost metagenome]